MKKNDTYLGIVFCIITLIYFFMTSKLPEKAAVYPKFITMVLMVLSIIFLVKTILSKEETSKNKLFADFQAKQFIFILSTALVYVGVIKILGYFVASFLFLLIILFGLRANKMYSVFTSAGFCIFIFVVFKVLLKVPLPKGFIF